jgi:SUMO ligase MMS21 Smc5/6 complex component
MNRMESAEARLNGQEEFNLKTSESANEDRKEVEELKDKLADLQNCYTTTTEKLNQIIADSDAKFTGIETQISDVEGAFILHENRLVDVEKSLLETRTDFEEALSSTSQGRGGSFSGGSATAK